MINVATSTCLEEQHRVTSDISAKDATADESSGDFHKSATSQHTSLLTTRVSSFDSAPPTDNTSSSSVSSVESDSTESSSEDTKKKQSKLGAAGIQGEQKGRNIDSRLGFEDLGRNPSSKNSFLLSRNSLRRLDNKPQHQDHSSRGSGTESTVTSEHLAPNSQILQLIRPLPQKAPLNSNTSERADNSLVPAPIAAIQPLESSHDTLQKHHYPRRLAEPHQQHVGEKEKQHAQEGEKKDCGSHHRQLEEDRKHKEQLLQQHLRQRRQREESIKAAVRLKEERIKRQQQKLQHEAQLAFPSRSHNYQHSTFPTAVTMGSSEHNENIHHVSQIQTSAPGVQLPAVYDRRGFRTMSDGTAMKKVQPTVNMDVDGPGGVVCSSSAPPTDFFERLVSEEVQELKAYARIIESQNRRLADLELIHEDLERRLEEQGQERMALEAALENQERTWAEKCKALEKEKDHWKQLVQKEQKKNERLLQQGMSKDQEIQRMIRRKYDSAKNTQEHGRDQTRSSRNMSISGDRVGTSFSQRHSNEKYSLHRSPHEILVTGGNVEAVRERNVTNSLLDFFGM